MYRAPSRLETLPTEIQNLVIPSLESRDVLTVARTSRILRDITDKELSERYETVSLSMSGRMNNDLSSLLKDILTTPSMTSCIRQVIIEGGEAAFYSAPTNDPLQAIYRAQWGIQGLNETLHSFLVRLFKEKYERRYMEEDGLIALIWTQLRHVKMLKLHCYQHSLAKASCSVILGIAEQQIGLATIPSRLEAVEISGLTEDWRAFMWETLPDFSTSRSDSA